jgi:hypothetical protein
MTFHTYYGNKNLEGENLKKRYGIMALILAGILIMVLPGQIAAWRNTGSYPVTLDTTNTDCRYPATYMVNSKEFTVWQQIDSTNGNWDIYLRWGNGVTWYPANPVRITNTGNWDNDDNDNEHPDVTATYHQDPEGENREFFVYIAWQYEDQDSYTWEIETCRVIINAITNTVTTIGYGRASDNNYPEERDSILPAIDTGDYYGEIHLVWEDYQDDNEAPFDDHSEIYYDRSINGISWTSDERVSPFVNPLDDQTISKDPTICANYVSLTSMDTVCILWEEYEPQYQFNSQIYIRTRSYWNQNTIYLHTHGPALVPNGGTSSNEMDPDVRFKEAEFCFVWSDDRFIDWEVYYEKVYYNGVLIPTFSSLLRVTNNVMDDEHPMIDLAKNFDYQPARTEIHIVWDTNRNGNRDVYACRGIKNAGGADSLSSSGQGGSDNRVSFTNYNEDYPDVNAKSRYGYCVFEKNSNTPWEIKYTMDP